MLCCGVKREKQRFRPSEATGSSVCSVRLGGQRKPFWWVSGPQRWAVGRSCARLMGMGPCAHGRVVRALPGIQDGEV